MTPEMLTEWRKEAERDQQCGFGLGWPGRVLVLIDALEDMTREALLSREATDKAVRSRVARHELERAFRVADAPEDSMLGMVGDTCRAPGYNGRHAAVGAGAVGPPPYVCHGCGGIFAPEED